MATNASAQTESMQQAASHFEEVLATCVSQENQFEATMAGLAGAFKGPAARNYQEVMQRWQADFGVIRTNLQSIIESLGGGVKHYHNMHNTNMDLISSLSGQFSGSTPPPK